MPRKKPFNPFYALLIVVGIAFSISACAYGVMSLRAMRGGLGLAAGNRHPLLEFLDAHGGVLLAVELGLLAVFTVGAIATDDFWTRRAERRASGGEGER